jgi:hypothetical protein
MSAQRVDVRFLDCPLDRADEQSLVCLDKPAVNFAASKQINKKWRIAYYLDSHYDWVISANQNQLCTFPCEPHKRSVFTVFEFRWYRQFGLTVKWSENSHGFKIDGWIRANFEVICQERHNHNKILLILTRKREPGEINTCWIAWAIFIDESSYSIWWISFWPECWEQKNH